MVSLKVIGDPEEVMRCLKTNRPLTLGQEIRNGDEATLRTFAAQYPHLVELVDGELSHKPESNKMLSKDTRYKSKRRRRK